MGYKNNNRMNAVTVVDSQTHAVIFDMPSSRIVKFEFKFKWDFWAIISPSVHIVRTHLTTRAWLVCCCWLMVDNRTILKDSWKFSGDVCARTLLIKQTKLSVLMQIIIFEIKLILIKFLYSPTTFMVWPSVQCNRCELLSLEYAADYAFS